MATVVAAASPPNIEGVSRAALFRKLALDTGFLQTGVATGGNTATLIDTTRLKTSQGSPSEWIGGWLRISETSNHLAPEGEISPISNFEPELGQASVEPYLTAIIEAGDKYELWKINPSIVKDVLDQCLTNELYLPCWSILSEVPDYDMEQSGVTYWSSGTIAPTKQSTAPRLGTSGKQYLRVVSVAAGDYAGSGLLYVEPGKSFHLSAAVRCVTAGCTAKLILYDETNGAEIRSATSKRLFSARINFITRIPSNCYTVSIRLANVEAAVTTEWDEVCFYDPAAADINLPWWVLDDSQVKGIFQYNPYSLGTDLWDATLRGERDSRFDVIKNFGGQSAFKAQARVGSIGLPLFILGTRNETAYADDNVDLKFLDINLLAACLKFKLYKLHSQPLVTGLLDSLNFKAMLGDVSKEYSTMAQSESEELNTTISSPTPWGQFIDHRFTYGGM